jgi:hypothetical protein
MTRLSEPFVILCKYCQAVTKRRKYELRHAGTRDLKTAGSVFVKLGTRRFY